MNDTLMDDDMDVDIQYHPRRYAEAISGDHSDEEDHWEAVTPEVVTPSSSPPPFNTATSKYSLDLTIDPLLYAELEKETAKYSTGVRVEDALLLLSFHRHAFVHQPPWQVVRLLLRISC